MIRLIDILTEQRVNRQEYERRYNLVQKYLDQLKKDAPGDTYEEKLKYMWAHHPEVMKKLLDGLTALRKPSIFGRIGDEPIQSHKSKFESNQYYIRFGDIPKSGKSKNYATGEMERGVSAYPVKWNVSKNKWEIIENQLEEFSALFSLTDDIVTGKGRPVYLIYGPELDSLGSDGEPMLSANDVQIVKKLEPHEFFSNEIGEDWYVQDR